MPDREKVRKGIAICLSRFHCGEDCPYYNAGKTGCMESLQKDTLALLKEQESVEQKTGHWIESKCLDECFWVCSECNFPSEAIAAPQLYKYCPNCGTKMAERR